MIYVVASVAIRSFVLFVHEFLYPNWHPDDQAKLFIYCFAASVLSVILSIVWKSEAFSSILLSVSGKGTSNDIFNSLLDLDSGTTATVVLKNGDRCAGAVYQADENGNDSWIALYDYVVYQADGKELSATDYSEETLMILRRSEIEYVYYAYPDNSKMSKKLKAYDETAVESK